MGMHGDDKCVFPLTSLQIGDLQSYLSDLSLFLAIESNKLYILVDNRPWLRDLVSGPAHLWQLMVTKSRLSPFANTKAQRRRKQGDKCSQPGPCKSKKYERWFPLIDAATLSKKRVLLPVKKIKNSLIFSNELHHTLYGFIVFEVAWTDVRGINYLNELQTDTSLALEAKIMLRWEFDSIQQAASSMPLWFSGTCLERQQLKDYLDSIIGEVFYDAEDNFPKSLCFDEDNNDGIWVEGNSAESGCGTCSLYPGVIENRTDEPHTPPTTGPYKRRKLTKSTSTRAEVQFYTEEPEGGIKCSLGCSGSYGSDCENNIDAKPYWDVLILFRFNDRDLPFKLRAIIMSDLRLLTLLEAGLPSWVIFLQSYPGFCNIYRPWMCPLARVLYVLMSIVTVLIGFYDLYKNVPVLKATAFHLCGPLFDWIESWDMVSRIKYLGTMLFLHNFEKAINWFLTVTRTTCSFFSVLTQPLTGPLVEFIDFLLPTWNVLIHAVGGLFSIVLVVVESTWSVLGDLVELVLWPLWSILSLIWTIASSVLYPVIWLLWEMLYAPILLTRYVASLLALIFLSLWDVVQDFWQSVSGILRLASTSSEVKASTYQVSMWRLLWNDLFSQVFRAIRSILNGFVAFFAACNRHRLSIYNHIRDFIQRLLAREQASQSPASRNRRPIHGSQNTPDVVRRIHTRGDSPLSSTYKADTDRAH